MRFINYFLIAVLLTGCTSVYGQDETPNPTPEKVKENIRKAEQGDAKAQYNLGNMYRRGEGVPQDYILAYKWYKLAAEEGYAEAQYNLGTMYDLGSEGVVPKDDQLAIKWYKLAAEQGHARAQAALGGMYALGQGVPKDYVLAYKWVNLAAAQGHKNASNNRDVLAKRMNTSQIQEAQRLAREFKPKKEKP